MKRTIPAVQQARDGRSFIFTGLQIFPLAITNVYVRLMYIWEGDKVLPPVQDTAILTHEEFNNLINS